MPVSDQKIRVFFQFRTQGGGATLQLKDDLFKCLKFMVNQPIDLIIFSYSHPKILMKRLLQAKNFKEQEISSIQFYGIDFFFEGKKDANGKIDPNSLTQRKDLIDDCVLVILKEKSIEHTVFYFDSFFQQFEQSINNIEYFKITGNTLEIRRDSVYTPSKQIIELIKSGKQAQSQQKDTATSAKDNTKVVKPDVSLKDPFLPPERTPDFTYHIPDQSFFGSSHNSSRTTSSSVPKTSSETSLDERLKTLFLPKSGTQENSPPLTYHIPDRSFFDSSFTRSVPLKEPTVTETRVHNETPEDGPS